jgi:hypothetical protein
MYFALVLVKLNSTEGAGSGGKTLILVFWWVNKFKSRLLKKETVI